MVKRYLNVIFDTSVWCALLKERPAKIEKIFSSHLRVYGYSKIKEELQKTPKKLHFKHRSRKKLAMAAYDLITNGKFLRHSIEIDKLAKKYYSYFKKLGGTHNWENINTDFTIVACASKFGMDIVYSEDKHSMLHKTSIKAYRHINPANGYRSPDFFKYENLKETVGI